jgi:hypothetical protein
LEAALHETGGGNASIPRGWDIPGVVFAIPPFVVPSSVVKEGRKWEVDAIGEPVTVTHMVC